MTTAGGVAERFNAPVLKTGEPARVPGVRIPSPPFDSLRDSIELVEVSLTAGRTISFVARLACPLFWKRRVVLGGLPG